MKKLNYNFQDAINLRGLTLDQANIFDPTEMNAIMAEQIIDFKFSIELASDLQGYDWQMPLWAEVLGHIDNSRRRNITKAEWKKHYSGWRTYIHQSENRSYTDSDKFSCV